MATTPVRSAFLDGTDVSLGGNPGGTIDQAFDATGCDYVRIIVRLGYPGSTVTACTYNGVAATLFASAGGTGDQATTLWYYVLSPATGSHTAHVTIADTGTARWSVEVNGFVNVDQTTVHRTAVTQANANSTLALSPVSVAGDLVVDAGAFAVSATPQTGTPSSGQTVITNNNASTDTNGCVAMSSYKTATGTTTAMGWSGNGQGFDVAYVAAALVPATGGGGGSTPAATNQSTDVGLECGVLSGVA